MNRIKSISTVVILILSLLGITLWMFLFDRVNFYVICAVMLVLSMLPFFIGFERRRMTAAEISLIATLIALAVASRAVFYLIPQVKPIGAVVIVSAACLGAEKGYVIGAFSAFISNFIFGQGYWTPFQMAALGAVGLISGLLFYKPLFLNKFDLKGIKFRILLSLVGFVLTFALYGAIVDLSTIFFTYGNKPTLSGILSIYASGAPFSLVFGAATAVFLFLFGESFIRKIKRVTLKFNDRVQKI